MNISSMPDSLIRPYQDSDQTAIFQIAADTAFFGEPIEAFLEDRSVFLDAFVRYYTTLEAKYIWVAVGRQGVTGYLLGCPDTSLQAGRWIRNSLPTVLGKMVRGCYRIGKRTLSYGIGMVTGWLGGETPGVKLTEYPAHLHINVKDGYRGAGVGWQLMEAYLGQLRHEGVRGVHLETTSQNQAACHLYEKIGFCLLGAHLSRYWSKYLGHTVENRRYGLKLA